MKELTTVKDAVPVEASAGVRNAREAAKRKPNKLEWFAAICCGIIKSIVA